MNTPESLLQQALVAVGAGDLANAAVKFERAAELLAPTRPEDAFHALESAARIALIRTDVATARMLLERARPLARDRVRLLRLEAEVADLGDDPAAREAAWTAVAIEGDVAERLTALLKLGNFARTQQRHASSAAYFTEALRELPPDAEPYARSEILLDLAQVRTANNELAAALTALDDAEASVPAINEDKIAILRNRIAGQRAVVAYTSGDIDAALRAANTVRERAVEVDDVMTYVGASALIAMIYERRDQLVDAYDTYIRARESLAQLLGPDGRGFVAPAVQMFEARLGPDRFAVVWNEWVARRRAAT
ncbi:MAG TPA: hypothetical protein VGM39_25110 [Kofleriaceae bacterium]|jgi:tetratricopeptide (TPR) repeat protein